MLPDPPRYDLWPVPVRSAMRLRGALVPCGPGLRGVGWPETPRVRLSALAPWLGNGRVATHLTAAWIWGAAREPGIPLRASAGSGRAGLPARDALMDLQELRCPPPDIARFGDFATTTPLRTICDILYDSRGFGRDEAVSCRLLFALVDGGSAAVYERLLAHRRPHRVRASERLSTMTRFEVIDSRRGSTKEWT